MSKLQAFWIGRSFYVVNAETSYVEDYHGRAEGVEFARYCMEKGIGVTVVMEDYDPVVRTARQVFDELNDVETDDFTDPEDGINREEISALLWGMSIPEYVNIPDFLYS